MWLKKSSPPTINHGEERKKKDKELADELVGIKKPTYWSSHPWIMTLIGVLIFLALIPRTIIQDRSFYSRHGIFFAALIQVSTHWFQL